MLQHYTCCMVKNTVKSRAPTCLDSRHRGCSCVTPHSSFPIPWVFVLSEQKHKDQSYDKGPVTFRMKGIFAFSTYDRRAWNILPFLKSPTQGDGRAIYPAHPLPAYTFFGLIYYFPKYNIQRCWPHLFSDVRDIPLTPNCIPPTAPKPNLRFQIPRSK